MSATRARARKKVSGRRTRRGKPVATRTRARPAVKRWQTLVRRFRLGRRAGSEQVGETATRFERFALRLPWPYLLSTVLLALLAYAYLLAFPTLATFFLGRALFFATRWDWWPFAQSTLACALFVLLSNLLLTRVRPQPPALLQLPYDGAPRLHKMIDDVRVKCRAPVLDQVFLDGGADVRLMFTPRNGYLLSWGRSLVIGVPVMQLVSPLHFRGLLARRLGQASRRANRLTRWLTMMRAAGPSLLRACPNWRHPDSIVVRAFFLWFTPLYAYWSLHAARRDELHGDRYMMDHVNSRDAGELVAAQLIAERYLKEKYFARLLELARKYPDPAPIAYGGLDRKFNRYWSDADAKRWLEQAFSGPAPLRDPRPSLRRRLAEMGHSSARVPAPLHQAASRELFGYSLTEVLAKLDEAWAKEIAPRWRQLHAIARRDARRLRDLNQKARKSALPPRESREMAALVERCLGKAKAKPFYKQLLVRSPADAQSNFAAGRFLLSGNDAQGVVALQEAMRLDERFAEPAGKLIEEFEARQRNAAAAATGVHLTPPETAAPIEVTETHGVITETGVQKLIDSGQYGAVSPTALHRILSESAEHQAVSETPTRDAGRDDAARTGAQPAAPSGQRAAPPQPPVVPTGSRMATPAGTTRGGAPAPRAATGARSTTGVGGHTRAPTSAGLQTAITDSDLQRAIDAAEREGLAADGAAGKPGSEGGQPKPGRGDGR